MRMTIALLVLAILLAFGNTLDSSTAVDPPKDRSIQQQAHTSNIDMEKDTFKVDALGNKVKRATPNDVQSCASSLASIEENGYPTNISGETFGPDIYNNTDPALEPDLILAQNKDGLVGYIRKADIKDGASSLEEAINWEPRNYTIPLYLEDGVTIIGEFEIGDECMIESD